MIMFNNPDHGFKIAELAQSSFNPATDQVISRVIDGRLAGGSIYQNYTGEGGSIGMHTAGLRPRWVNRDLLWVTFDYPFNQLKVSRIFGQVPSDNQAALGFDFNLGFRELLRVEGVFPDADMVLVQMLREECRWLHIKPKGLA